MQFLRLMAATGAHMRLERRQPRGPGPHLAARCMRALPCPMRMRVAGDALTTWACRTRFTSAARPTGSSSDMIATGADALELDYKTDAGLAHSNG